MARRRAPQRRCQGASKGSLRNEADQQPSGEAAGPSRCQTSRYKVGCCCLGRQVEVVARTWPNTAADGPAEEEVPESLLLAAPSGSCWCLLRDLTASVDNAGKGTERGLGTLRNVHALLAEQAQKMQLLLEEVAQLRAEISSAKEVNLAAPKMASEVYVEMSDWALKSSGASIDTQRTSETYDCKDNWRCKVLCFFCTANAPDTILQPDVSPGNCWAFRGHQGQVVIRLPARVHLTAVTVQHISKEVSSSGTVISAPRDVAVFGVDADGEEETLGVFKYDVAKEAIQTFPLKNAPLPRAFSYIKLLVKSNWGNPAYTCIYRVQVHGKMAKPESLH
ncbi:LOW QUALITY PROTEIN: sperm-associated antigen 4 protein-like [Phoenicopterus ruber ruber]